MSGLARHSGLLVGTWNLNAGQPQRHRAAQQDWLRDNADLWLLTEVHMEAVDGFRERVVSDPIAGMPERRWSGIVSRWPLQEIRSGHPTLALARARLPIGTTLLASSVLPWRGAGRYWPAAAETSYSERFRATLATHCEAIANHTAREEHVIWGGDFNQALVGRETVGSVQGRKDLQNAFNILGLQATTADCHARQPESFAIDHIAVPSHWHHESNAQEVQTAEGAHLSDHPAYVTTLSLREQ